MARDKGPIVLFVLFVASNGENRWIKQIDNEPQTGRRRPKVSSVLRDLLRLFMAEEGAEQGEGAAIKIPSDHHHPFSFSHSSSFSLAGSLGLKTSARIEDRGTKQKVRSLMR